MKAAFPGFRRLLRAQAWTAWSRPAITPGRLDRSHPSQPPRARSSLPGSVLLHFAPVVSVISTLPVRWACFALLSFSCALILADFTSEAPVVRLERAALPENEMVLPTLGVCLVLTDS